ncbi:hypothetical protein PTSG_02724 [Salpingoeca rosetta]|uniref:Uncharacterized protein n=1 Tax=Salpingoeca rosetta (strain ATCC 50818 / BSB-021) TaxID=946362 RepID=F2U342_SALR5|nr:uncharacterized protein PTSG_02724 [Salpingoeca rosetta]EGD82036.1 hypothetical protein PTSG_02724 [Salpingoeca rosetta]|eukprot:XP_004996219.1 hypothetical protein PTSG_02724 [Salpingoeca rosetta]
MEEDEYGALHINTSDPEKEPVFVNGVDVGKMFEVVQQQASMLEEQMGVNDEQAGRLMAQQSVNDVLKDKNRALQHRIEGYVAAFCWRFPVSPSTDTTTMANVGKANEDWIGGVSASTGLIFGIPFHSSSVLIIDPATNTADTTTISGLPEGGAKWGGGVLGGNGLIFGFPAHATSVLIINPYTNAVDSSSLGEFSSGGGRWISGVAAMNGLIFGIPWQTSLVLVINPAVNVTDTITVTETSAVSRGYHHHLWVCFGSQVARHCIGRNGLIYGVPDSATFVLIVDPTDNTTDASSITGLSSSNRKWRGAVLARNGNIIGIPRSTGSALIINPTSNTVDDTSLETQASGEQWHGGVLATNGLIYGIPHSSSDVLIIDPGC